MGCKIDCDKIHQWLPVIAILGTEFCERLSYYGIGASLILFLRSKLGYSTKSATVTKSIWTAFTTIFAFLGGYVSDVCLGRKKTIIISLIIYFLGLLAVSILMFFFDLGGPDNVDTQTIEIVFWIFLYLMTFGGGGIKANVGIFGADQLHKIAATKTKQTASQMVDLSSNAKTKSDELADRLLSANDTEDPIGQNELEQAQATTELVASFWNWFYISINAGAVISYTVIAYLCQNVSFSVGWSIPTMAMFVGLIMFLLRNGSYYEVPRDPEGSMVSKFLSITWYSIRNQSRRKKAAPNVSVKDEASQRLSTAGALSNLTDDGPEPDDPGPENPVLTKESHWLDVAKNYYGGKFDDGLVDEVKGVYAVFGFLPFMTLYWMVYEAMNSLYFSQGCQMDYNITSTFEVPIASINNANTIVILITVPIMDRWIYPILKWGMLKKIGFGYFILTLAMLIAGFVEIARKASPTLDEPSTCDDKVYISKLSVMWQIPQYLMVGISEVFASITSLDFFSGQAPDNMKAIVYGLNLLVIGLGSVLASQLVVMVDSWNPQWIPSDLDEGYLEYYYFMTAGIMMLTLIAFIPYAARYKYKEGTDISKIVKKESDVERARARSSIHQVA